MVRDLNFWCARSALLNEVVGAGLWPDLYAFSSLAEMGSFSDQSTSTAVMANIPPTATGVVITQTSVVYVVCSRVVSSSDASSGSSSCKTKAQMIRCHS
jgi:hypothetical protein